VTGAASSGASGSEASGSRTSVIDASRHDAGAHDTAAGRTTRLSTRQTHGGCILSAHVLWRWRSVVRRSRLANRARSCSPRHYAVNTVSPSCNNMHDGDAYKFTICKLLHPAGVWLASAARVADVDAGPFWIPPRGMGDMTQFRPQRSPSCHLAASGRLSSLPCSRPVRLQPTPRRPAMRSTLLRLPCRVDPPQHRSTARFRMRPTALAG